MTITAIGRAGVHRAARRGQPDPVDAVRGCRNRVSGQGIELVWVSKLGEPVDQNWFCAADVDLILVIQGQLKFEFESSGLPDRLPGVGEVIVLPPGKRCRAYR